MIRILPKVLAATLILALSDGVLRFLPTVLISAMFQQGISAAQIGLYSGLIGYSSYVVNPLLVFLVMYFMARGLDLPSDFGSALLSLLVGSLAGIYAGSLIVLGVLFATFQSQNFGLFPVFALVDAPGAIEFTLIGFASLAIGYFVRRPKVTDRPKQDNR